MYLLASQAVQSLDKLGQLLPGFAGHLESVNAGASLRPRTRNEVTLVHSEMLSSLKGEDLL